MSEAARSHRSDLRVKPYMDPPGGTRSDAGGPLAELAQIVGQDDPFRAMFSKGKGVARATPEPIAAFPAPADRFAEPSDRHATEDDDHAFEDAGVLRLRSTTHDWVPAEADAQQWDDGYDHSEHTPAAYDNDGSKSRQPAAEMPIDAPHYVAPPLTPDLWAEPPNEGDDDPGGSPALSDENALDAKAPRRPLVVLMAVLALTGGGLAATFLSRSGSSVAASSGGGSAPTIMAASGPTKIKQTDGASDMTPEDADATLLGKNGASSGGPVKVVNSQEQPMDLAQLPKSGGGQTEAVSSTSGSPFPEPKKVKTFLVRPDGSLVGSSPAGAVPAPVRPTVPQFAAGSVPAGEDGNTATPPARVSAPKTITRSVTTPKGAPMSIADLAATDGGDAKATQPASPGAKAGSGSRPVEKAEAVVPDATATTGSSGNFGLQLAASPSEQDARSAFAKLQKKYSELGPYQPTVKKVDNGQKTVYRLRVGNLSQDQAKTLCSSLQASGGTCFVVHN